MPISHCGQAEWPRSRRQRLADIQPICPNRNDMVPDDTVVPMIYVSSAMWIAPWSRPRASIASNTGGGADTLRGMWQLFSRYLTLRRIVVSFRRRIVYMGFPGIQRPVNACAPLSSIDHQILTSSTALNNFCKRHIIAFIAHKMDWSYRRWMKHFRWHDDIVRQPIQHLAYFTSLARRRFHRR